MKTPIHPPLRVNQDKHRITNSRERPHGCWLNVSASLNKGKYSAMTSICSFLHVSPLGNATTEAIVPHFMNSLIDSSGVKFRALPTRGLSLLFAFVVMSSTLFAQTDPNAAPADAANQRGRARRDQNAGGQAEGQDGGRRNFNPEEMLQQRMTRMRELLDIPDDAEWKVISERITTVSEAQRLSMAGGIGGGWRGGFGGPPGAIGDRSGGSSNRGGRQGLNANPEQDALRQAVTDKLPDAEIKSRLTSLREARKAREEKLSKTQEDLRAVLSVRQEAVAVMLGLLP